MLWRLRVPVVVLPRGINRLKLLVLAALRAIIDA